MMKKYKLHLSQLEIYYDQLLDKTSSNYNIGGYVNINGPVQEEALIQAVASLLEAFDMHRLSFDLSEHEPLCYFEEEHHKIQIHQLDFSSKENPEQSAIQWMQDKFNRPFALGEEPLFDYGILRTGKESVKLYIHYHHLIADGHAISVALQYIAKKYSEIVAGVETHHQQDTYEAELISSHNYLNSSQYANDAQYWKQRFLALPQPLLNKAYKEIKREKTGAFIINIPEEKKQAYLKTCKELGVSNVQHLALMALHIYFGRVATDKNFVFGLDAFKRRKIQWKTFGLFAGIMPFKMEYEENIDLVKLAAKIKGTLLKDYRRINYPLSHLNRQIGLMKSNRQQLFEIVLNYVLLDVNLDFKGLTSTAYDLRSEYTSLPLMLWWRDYGPQQDMQLRVDFRHNYIAESETKYLVDRLLFIMDQFQGNLNENINDIPIIPIQEKTLIDSFSVNQVNYPASKSIIDLFEERAKAAPEKTALFSKDQQLTYKELDQKSTALGNYLSQTYALTAGDMVGFMLDNSAWSLIALLGIMKSGAAYVPIDIKLPENRKQFLLDDTKLKALIIDSGSLFDVINYTVPVFSIDIQLDGIEEEFAGLILENKPSSEDPAYVIYTSGTLGNPKGVLVSHRNIIDYHFGLQQAVNIEQNDSFALMSSLSADLGNTVLFASLLSGGTLHIFPQQDLMNADLMHDYFSQHPIDCIKIVPSHWNALSSNEKVLLPRKCIVLGGEVLPPVYVEKIAKQAPELMLVNHYGPTETTIGKLLHQVKLENDYPNIPIGKPFSNTLLFIVDENNELCPLGVPGELLIGGDGVAMGYHNRAELNKEKFIPNLFSAHKTNLYRTGDLVKMDEKGNVHFIGRIDDQVKIRGYRVEPSEITTVLSGCESVRQCTVSVAVSEAGTKKLVAYIVPQDVLDESALIAYLKLSLPDYMIPSIFMELDQIPLTSNGKVDRKMLPEITSTQDNKNYTPPRNETEQQMVAIWTSLLEEQKIGIHDNFFELGGDSIIAIQVISKLKAVQLHLQVQDIFDYPTIAELFEYSHKTFGSQVIVEQELEKGVKLSFIDNVDLILTGMEGKMTKEQANKVKQNKFLIEFIKTNKEELVAFLKNELPANNQVDKPKIVSIYKLSPMQEGILFHWLFNDDSSTYITQVSFDIPSAINVLNFKKAWEFVISKHTILRTTFLHDKFSVPVQCVYDKAKLPFEVIELNNTETFDEILEKDLKKGFDLGKPPLIRMTLVKTGKDSSKFFWTKHHLLWDGWSDQLIFKEVIDTYKAYTRGVDPTKKEEDKYEDYIKFLGEIDSYKENKFWTAYLNDFKETSLLPFTKSTLHRNRSLAKSEKIALVIEHDLKEKITDFSKKAQITISSLMQGIWALLIAKYTGKEDVLFGVTVAGRPAEIEYNQKIGLFINTIPLRILVDENKKLLDWLKGIQLNHTHTKTFQYTSLREIQHCALVKEDFFDSIINVRNYPALEPLTLEGQTYEVEHFNVSRNNNYLLSIEVDLYPDSFVINFEYNKELLQAEYATQISKHFEHVLKQIVNGKDGLVKDIELITPAEQQQLLTTFNQTATEYPKSTTILDLFREMANRYPDQNALIVNQKTLSYQQIDEQSTQLAQRLLKEGVGTGKLIGICLNRSVEMMIGLLAILKTNNAFVPLDPKHPEDRNKFIIEDSNIELLLTNQAWSRQFKEVGGLKIIDCSTREQAQGKEKLPLPQPDDLAYVIYTSGSTGKPKGVMIEHRALLNLLLAMSGQLNFKQGDRLLAVTTFSFDIAYLELFMPLITGGTVIVAADEAQTNATEICALLSKHRPSLMQATPATWQLLVESSWTNEEKTTILTGGEAISEQLKNALTRFGSPVWNVYGPTETTIWSSMKKLNENQAVNIGRPIANTRFYVLNKQDQLCPIGLVGELCIAGDGLARGYLNKPELTQQNFSDNPLLSGQELIYRTGDLAKWLPSGEIDFLGRADTQVKLRGYRIELGEIEAILTEYTGVKKAAVLVNEEHNKDKKLIAYIVSNGTFDKKLIVEFLKQKLPGYMIPAFIIPMDKMPITPNGKLDKNALPSPDGAMLTTREMVLPKTESEHKMLSIWKNILGIENISVTDNFFELGGHSLLATRMLAAIRKQFERAIPLRKIFDHNTISELCQYLEENDKTKPQLPTVSFIADKPVNIPLSFAQERLWFIDKLTGAKEYHLPFVAKFKGLDAGILERSFKKIIARHEVLRSVIRTTNNIPYQQVISAENWKMNTGHKAYYTEQEINDFIHIELREPFDLAADYMLRASLLNDQEGFQVLTVVVHHIASDALSNLLLVKDLAAYYNAEQSQQNVIPEPLPFQYADFAIWQRANFTDQYIAKGLSWWKNQLEAVVLTNLPTDKATLVNSSEAAKFEFSIDTALSSQINQLAIKNKCTPFVVLLATFNILLSKYSSQKDICIGTPVANRKFKELESLVGFFVNTLAIRNQLDYKQPFSAFLDQVKSSVFAAFEHKDIPFEQIINALDIERDLHSSPVFNVMFVMHNMGEVQQLDLKGAQQYPEPFMMDKAPYEITLIATDANNRLQFRIEYLKELFQEATIKRMAGHFTTLLQSIVAEPETKIAQLPILTTSETATLHAFNQLKLEIPARETLATLFEKQAKQRPNATALRKGDQTVTYEELNTRANQLAHYILEKGFKPDQVAALLVDRSFEMIIAILAVLKCGGTYLPIDPEQPASYSNYILTDGNVSLLLTSTNYGVPFEKRMQVVDVFDEKLQAEPVFNPNIAQLPSSIAYIIYTSGSSGKPKGVLIENKAVVNLALAQKEFFGINAQDKILQFSPYYFDASVEQTWLALATGATLVLMDKETLGSNEHFNAYLKQTNISHLDVTPSFLNSIDLQDHPSLRRIVVGGEECKVELAHKFKDKYQFYNMYGPTETTVTSIAFHISNTSKLDNKVPIGKPLPNTTAYVLDEYRNMQPIGIAGELYIGGVGLAVGYLNQPELTAKSFVNNPFNLGSDSRLYKTGDLVKWLPDGNLVYLGRKDEQLKIRGYRVEPGTIEAAIMELEQINRCIVVGKETKDGNKQLIAYLVATDSNIDQRLVQHHLKQILPAYMIPAHFVQITAIPLTANGKLDIKKLPDPLLQKAQAPSFTEPRNETDHQLIKIWSELLGLEKIDLTDNFFDLGGHSLLAVKLSAVVEEQFDISISVKTLFQYSSIEELSDYLSLKQERDTSEEDEETIEFINL